MRASSKEVQRKLNEIVERQDGFFTTKQAKAAGYPDPTHVYHVKRGDWVRERRGIYRLAHYPLPQRPDLILWHLWSRNRREEPQGVFSHQTALALHELSDLNPAKLHMTVPGSFRRNSRIPAVLVLHYADLTADETEDFLGVRVTKPLKTILDLLQSADEPHEVLSQALKEGLKRGVITLALAVENADRNAVLKTLLKETTP